MIYQFSVYRRTVEVARAPACSAGKTGLLFPGGGGENAEVVTRFLQDKLNGQLAGLSQLSLKLQNGQEARQGLPGSECSMLCRYALQMASWHWSKDFLLLSLFLPSNFSKYKGALELPLSNLNGCSSLAGNLLWENCKRQRPAE